MLYWHYFLIYKLHVAKLFSKVNNVKEWIVLPIYKILFEKEYYWKEQRWEDEEEEEEKEWGKKSRKSEKLIG